MRAIEAGASTGQIDPSQPWRFLPRVSGPVAVIFSLAFLGLIAYVDIITSTDVSFAVWYTVPVVIVTWFVGRSSGLIMAVISTVVWLTADILGAATYTKPIFAYFNAGSRLVFFVIGVMLLSAFKNLSTRLESMVEERTRRLRRLASQLSDAEDTERRRLAYDIHDGFGQILSLLKLNLAAALPETSDGAPARQRITDAVGMVDDLIDRSRTLTFDLHPAMLDHLGLVPTLHRYSEQFTRRTNVDVIVSEDGSAQPLQGLVANYLFRSAKELLNNAAKHGQARQIVVGVHWAPQVVRVVIDDDGSGFDTDEVFAQRAQKGLGLTSIRERLLSLGGSLRLESGSGEGTRVVMELPLNSMESVA